MINYVNTMKEFFNKEKSKEMNVDDLQEKNINNKNNKEGYLYTVEIDEKFVIVITILLI